MTGTLQLRLHLDDLRLQLVEISSERLDFHVEIIDAGLAIVSGRSSSRYELVLVELLDAEVLVLDLIGLLLSQSCDHVGNGLASSPRRSRPKAEAL